MSLAMVRILIAIALCFPAGVSIAQQCYSEADNRRLVQGDLFRMAPPPNAATRNRYRFWPLTASISADVTQIVRGDKSVKQYWLHWANRCQRTRDGKLNCGRHFKGNYLAPPIKIDNPSRKNTRWDNEIRPFFTAREKANRCTLIQTHYALGGTPASWRSYAGPDLKIIPHDEKLIRSNAKVPSRMWLELKLA